jgi:hypothetical protein
MRRNNAGIPSATLELYAPCRCCLQRRRICGRVVRLVCFTAAVAALGAALDVYVGWKSSPRDSNAVLECVERNMVSRYTLRNHLRSHAGQHRSSRFFEDPLADELQRELVAAQLCSDNPCRSTAYLPVKGPGFDRHTSGLGSRFSSIAATLHFARSLDRPMFTQHETGGWAYTDGARCASRDHTCYFHRLTSCQEDDVDDLWAPPDWFRWPYGLIVSDWPNPVRGLQRYIWTDHSIPLRYYWETTITGRRLPAKYRERGWLWYHSQMLFFVLQPLPEVLSTVVKKKALVKTGNEDTPGSFAAERPVIAMHVRQGDKVKEKVATQFDCYMAVAERYRQETGVRDIWLLSDDDTLVQSAEKMYPAFNFLYNAVNASNGGGRFSNASLPTVAALDAGQLNGREVAMDGLTDILIAVECDYFIGTLSSNFGRTVLKLMYASYGYLPPHTGMDAVSNDWAGKPFSWEFRPVPQLQPLLPGWAWRDSHTSTTSGVDGQEPTCGALVTFNYHVG